MMASEKLIGRKLGDYTIQGLLGLGGMAHVYKGYDEDLQRYAAVKVIVPSATLVDDEQEYRERFMREARAIARLNHPRIVGLYQFGKIEAENLYYMAMAYIEGQDLRQILKAHQNGKTHLTIPELLQIMRDIASALDYAHSMGVIHRDVKPSNIMVTGDGHAVLTDFGLALSSTEGTLGNTFGSVHYIAPEQAVSSAQASAQSDLYSLGVVLYEILTGRVPFDDSSAMTVALKHISDPPQPPSQVNPNIPSQVEAVIMTLLDKDPQRRYASGAQFIHALEAALANPDDEDTEDLWAQPYPTGGVVPPVSPAASTTDPRKPTRQVQAPADADARAILGDDADSAYAGWEDDRPTHVTDPSKPNPTQPSAALAERGGNRPVVWLIGLVVALLLGGGGLALLVMQNAAAENEQATGTAVALLVAQETAAAQQTAAQATADADATAQAAIQLTQDSAQQAMLLTETALADLTMTQVIAEFTAEQVARLTLSVTAPPTATETPSTTPTPTATFTPSPTPTRTPTATPTPTPSDTPTPGLRAGIGQPQLLLRYDTRTIVLYNRDASASIAIAGLEFVQGNMRYSAQNLASSGLTPRSCAQLWTVDFTELPRDEFPADICESRRGFASTGSPFWLSATAEATFVVRRLGRVLAECPALPPDFIGEQRCVIDLR